MSVFMYIWIMKWIFWFFIVNIISFIALMKGMVGDGNMFVGAIVALSAWGLFIWAIASNQERKRKSRNRTHLLDEYLKQHIKSNR